MQAEPSSSDKPFPTPAGVRARVLRFASKWITARTWRAWVAFLMLIMGLAAVFMLRLQQTPVVRSPATADTPPTIVVPRQPRYADFAAEPASPDARFIANWVTDSGDNHNLSFVIIDKKNTRLFVFNPKGKLLGTTAVLLGTASGDDSVPGIGQRPLAQVRPEERTTPAGRFLAEPGRNLSGEDVVWVDYHAAVSMHRVRTTNATERRLERLGSPTIQDNRISFGCINLPVAFYENVLMPQFKARSGLVYILPEVKPMRQVFARAYDPFTTYGSSGAL